MSETLLAITREWSHLSTTDGNVILSLSDLQGSFLLSSNVMLFCMVSEFPQVRPGERDAAGWRTSRPLR